jgi:hypothetical protein
MKSNKVLPENGRSKRGSIRTNLTDEQMRELQNLAVELPPPIIQSNKPRTLQQQ